MKTKVISPTSGKTTVEINEVFEDIYLRYSRLSTIVATTAEEVEAAQVRLRLEQLALSERATALSTFREGGDIGNYDSGVVYLDAHDLFGGTVTGTAVKYLPEYGVITLDSADGIGTESNLLTITDSVGTVWTPMETMIEYSYDGSTWYPDDLSTSLSSRNNMLRAVDGKLSTAMVIPVGTETEVYIKVTAPLTLLPTATINAIALNVQPTFKLLLEEAVYTVGAVEYNFFDTAAGFDTQTIPVDGLENMPFLFIVPNKRIGTATFKFAVPAIADAELQYMFINHVGFYYLDFVETAVATIDLSTSDAIPESTTSITVTVNPDESENPTAIIDGLEVSIPLSIRSTATPTVVHNIKVEYTTP